MSGKDSAAKCSVHGKRHKWAFVKNVWQHQITLRSARSTKRGVYRCDCGEARVGQPCITRAEEATP
jgi:hypothetical protein